MYKHEEFIAEHPEVAEWLRNRPDQTRRKFASQLMRFCEAVGMTPEEWRNLDKFEARDIAWEYVRPKIKEHPTVAKADLVALKSWFRFKDGEKLPFDGSRGGKHYMHVKYRRPSYEHIPNKNEMYQIIDMASSLRDKAILLLLFQAGFRVNVLEHLTYGHVEDQLDQDIITFKVTGELDYKLRSMDIGFYYTFVDGEGAETLRRYCKLEHKNSGATAPLFRTKTGKPISQKWVWNIVKMCVRRAGYDPKTISTHTLRKAFRKVVRQADIDDDDKEQLMGHVLSGSREAYYDKKDVELIREAYLKCNFGRGPSQKLKNRIEKLEQRDNGLLTVVQRLQEEIARLKAEVKALKPEDK